ncbi:MAG: hypothetical protein ACXACI_16545 [Candidatus Hodarchaeales archaeon]|jgi:hypothetical protein
MKSRLFIIILAIVFVFGLSFISIADDDDDQQDSTAYRIIAFEAEPEDFPIIAAAFDEGACAPCYADVDVDIQPIDDDDDETLLDDDLGDRLLDMLNASYMELVPAVMLVCAASVNPSDPHALASKLDALAKTQGFKVEISGGPDPTSMVVHARVLKEYMPY